MGKKGEGRKERERKKNYAKRMREGWTEDREGKTRRGGREEKLRKTMT